MGAATITMDSLRAMVKKAMLEYGMDMANFEEQCQHWLVCLKSENPHLEVVYEDDWLGVEEEETLAADVVDEVCTQPEWLSSVCDEVVYGKGAPAVSVYAQDAVSSCFVVKGSQQPGVAGYGIVCDDYDVCGLFPLLEAHSCIRDSYVQAMRVKPGGSLHLYLHEGLDVSIGKLREYGLGQVDSTVFDNPERDLARVREASTLDFKLREVILDVEYPFGYCYLGAVSVGQLIQAAEELGSGPDPKVFSAALVSGRYAPSGYLQRGEVSLNVNGGVAHLSKTTVGEPVSGVQNLLDQLSSSGAAKLAGSKKKGPGFDLNDLLQTPSSSGRSRRYSPASEVSGMTGAEVYTMHGVVSSPSQERGYCAKCDCDVVLSGHEFRCRPKRVKQTNEVRDALVGDACHSYDVKQLVAACVPDDKQLTVVVQGYVAAHAQRAYLSKHHPGVCAEGYSDHVWGTMFEVMYHGSFRRDYLKWLIEDLKVSVVLAETVLQKVGTSVETALSVAGLTARTRGASSSVSSDYSPSVSIVADQNLSVTFTSMRRISNRASDGIVSVTDCEKRAMERLRRSKAVGKAAAEEYRALASAPEYSTYRQQCQSILESLVFGSVTKVLRVMGLRGGYVIRVLSSLMSWVGVTAVKVKGGSMREGYLKFEVGEYVVDLPVPQDLRFSFEDVKPKECVMCGKRHWVVSDGRYSVDCCVLDKQGAEFADYYCALVRDTLKTTL